MSRTAASHWSEFAGSVISPEAPPEQFLEMRMAFHAGMMAALSETRPGSPPPSWRRLWSEVSEFLRSDYGRLVVAHAAAGASPRPEDDCRRSAIPGRLAVSRCLEHDRVEIWVDDRPYALDDERARKVGKALVAAAATGCG